MMVGVTVSQRTFIHVAVDWSYVWIRVPACVNAIWLMGSREGLGMEIEAQDVSVQPHET